MSTESQRTQDDISISFVKKIMIKQCGQNIKIVLYHTIIIVF